MCIPKRLAQVGLVYLADRPGVLTEEVNWEEELSLGEKQRLAMARLYYHKPDYVVLDECTSACAGVMEHRLYNRCKEMGITVITISVRLYTHTRYYHVTWCHGCDIVSMVVMVGPK